MRPAVRRGLAVGALRSLAFDYIAIAREADTKRRRR